MKWICNDQDVAQQVGLRWAERIIGMEYPFDEKSKAIMLFEGDVLCAVTCYTDYCRRNVAMHIASDGSRKWMTPAFLKASFAYPFEQLGVARVTGLVTASNPRALKFDLRLGFRIEGRMRQASPDGSDLLVLGMLRHECRHLKDKHGHGQRRFAAAVA